MINNKLTESFDLLLDRTFKRKFNDSKIINTPNVFSKFNNYIKHKFNRIILYYKYNLISNKDYTILLAIIINHKITSINDSRLDYALQNNDK